MSGRGSPGQGPRFVAYFALSRRLVLLTVLSVQGHSWRHGVSRYQWLVLFVAWLGWVFDSMDATIYTLVLHPALHELLQAKKGAAVSSEEIGWYGGIIFPSFSLGGQSAG